VRVLATMGTFGTQKEVRMAMVGQFSRLDYVNNTTKTVTIPINFPDWIHAHTHLYFVGGEDLHAECGIIQVVGAKSGVESLSEGDIWRKNVLTLTTYFFGWDCGMSASTIIDFWS
jgi:hypothetical protein